MNFYWKWVKIKNNYKIVNKYLFLPQFFLRKSVKISDLRLYKSMEYKVNCFNRFYKIVFECIIIKMSFNVHIYLFGMYISRLKFISE